MSILPISKQSVYDKMAVPAGNQCGPNCGVTAVAVAAGVTFDEAWRVCHEAVNENRVSLGMRRILRRWSGGTSVADREIALHKLGVKTREVPLEHRMYLATWAARHARGDRRYMVRTTGHVQIVRGMTVTDQYQTAVDMSEYECSRKFVTHVLELED